MNVHLFQTRAKAKSNAQERTNSFLTFLASKMPDLDKSALDYLSQSVFRAYYHSALLQQANDMEDKHEI